MEKVKELFDLAMKVNEETEHDVFIYVSPHTDQMTLDIHLKGWKSGAKPDVTINYVYDDETLSDRYKLVKDKMKLDKWEIGYSEIVSEIASLLRDDYV